jgi:hypothetical protein
MEDPLLSSLARILNYVRTTGLPHGATGRELVARALGIDAPGDLADEEVAIGVTLLALAGNRPLLNVLLKEDSRTPKVH